MGGAVDAAAEETDGVELSGKNLSALATAIAVIAIVPLYQNHGLFSTNILVIVVQIAAVILMVWARVTMGMKSFHFTANPVMLFARMVFEEKLLVERFPEYAEYAARTKRVVPRLF